MSPSLIKSLSLSTINVLLGAHKTAERIDIRRSSLLLFRLTNFHYLASQIEVELSQSRLMAAVLGSELQPNSSLQKICLWHFWISTESIWGVSPSPLFTGSKIHGGHRFISRWVSGDESVAPWFDSGFYVATNADVSVWHGDPLEHWLRYGVAEIRMPAPVFADLKGLPGSANHLALDVYSKLDNHSQFLSEVLGVVEARIPTLLFELFQLKEFDKQGLMELFDRQSGSVRRKQKSHV